MDQEAESGSRIPLTRRRSEAVSTPERTLRSRVKKEVAVPSPVPKTPKQETSPKTEGTPKRALRKTSERILNTPSRETSPKKEETPIRSLRKSSVRICNTPSTETSPKNEETQIRSLRKTTEKISNTPSKKTSPKIAGSPKRSLRKTNERTYNTPTRRSLRASSAQPEDSPRTRRAATHRRSSSVQLESPEKPKQLAHEPKASSAKGSLTPTSRSQRSEKTPPSQSKLVKSSNNLSSIPINESTRVTRKSLSNINSKANDSTSGQNTPRKLNSFKVGSNSVTNSPESDTLNVRASNTHCTNKKIGLSPVAENKEEEIGKFSIADVQTSLSSNIKIQSKKLELSPCENITVAEYSSETEVMSSPMHSQENCDNSNESEDSGIKEMECVYGEDKLSDRVEIAESEVYEDQNNDPNIEPLPHNQSVIHSDFDSTSGETLKDSSIKENNCQVSNQTNNVQVVSLKRNSNNSEDLIKSCKSDSRSVLVKECNVVIKKDPAIEKLADSPDNTFIAKCSNISPETSLVALPKDLDSTTDAKTRNISETPIAEPTNEAENTLTHERGVDVKCEACFLEPKEDTESTITDKRLEVIAEKSLVEVETFNDADTSVLDNKTDSTAFVQYKNCDETFVDDKSLNVATKFSKQSAEANADASANVSLSEHETETSIADETPEVKTNAPFIKMTETIVLDKKVEVTAETSLIESTNSETAMVNKLTKLVEPLNNAQSTKTDEKVKILTSFDKLLIDDETSIAPVKPEVKSEISFTDSSVLFGCTEISNADSVELPAKEALIKPLNDAEICVAHKTDEVITKTSFFEPLSDAETSLADKSIESPAEISLIEPLNNTVTCTPLVAKSFEVKTEKSFTEPLNEDKIGTSVADKSVELSAEESLVEPLDNSQTCSADAVGANTSSLSGTDASATILATSPEVETGISEIKPIIEAKTSIADNNPVPLSETSFVLQCDAETSMGDLNAEVSTEVSQFESFVDDETSLENTKTSLEVSLVGSLNDETSVEGHNSRVSANASLVKSVNTANSLADNIINVPADSSSVETVDKSEAKSVGQWYNSPVKGSLVDRPNAVTSQLSTGDKSAEASLVESLHESETSIDDTIAEQSEESSVFKTLNADDTITAETPVGDSCLAEPLSNANVSVINTNADVSVKASLVEPSNEAKTLTPEQSAEVSLEASSVDHSNDAECFEADKNVEVCSGDSSNDAEMIAADKNAEVSSEASFVLQIDSDSSTTNINAEVLPDTSSVDQLNAKTGVTELVDLQTELSSPFDRSVCEAAHISVSSSSGESVNEDTSEEAESVEVFKKSTSVLNEVPIDHSLRPSSKLNLDDSDSCVTDDEEESPEEIIFKRLKSKTRDLRSFNSKRYNEAEPCFSGMDFLDNEAEEGSETESSSYSSSEDESEIVHIKETCTDKKFKLLVPSNNVDMKVNPSNSRLYTKATVANEVEALTDIREPKVIHGGHTGSNTRVKVASQKKIKPSCMKSKTPDSIVGTGILFNEIQSSENTLEPEVLRGCHSSYNGRFMVSSQKKMATALNKSNKQNAKVGVGVYFNEVECASGVKEPKVSIGNCTGFNVRFKVSSQEKINSCLIKSKKQKLSEPKISNNNNISENTNKVRVKPDSTANLKMSPEVSLVSNSRKRKNLKDVELPSAIPHCMKQDKNAETKTKKMKLTELGSDHKPLKSVPNNKMKLPEPKSKSIEPSVRVSPDSHSDAKFSQSEDLVPCPHIDQLSSKNAKPCYYAVVEKLTMRNNALDLVSLLRTSGVEGLECIDLTICSPIMFCKNLGYGVIQFSDEESMQDGINKSLNLKCNGKPLCIRVCLCYKPQNKRSSKWLSQSNKQFLINSRLLKELDC